MNLPGKGSRTRLQAVEFLQTFFQPQTDTHAHCGLAELGRGRGGMTQVCTQGISMTWAMPPVERTQLVLFSTTLDEVAPEVDPVRAVDVLLRSLDWSAFEQRQRR